MVGYDIGVLTFNDQIEIEGDGDRPSVPVATAAR